MTYIVRKEILQNNNNNNDAAKYKHAFYYLINKETCNLLLKKQRLFSHIIKTMLHVRKFIIQ